MLAKKLLFLLPSLVFVINSFIMSSGIKNIGIKNGNYITVKGLSEKRGTLNFLKLEFVV